MKVDKTIRIIKRKYYKFLVKVIEKINSFLNKIVRFFNKFGLRLNSKIRGTFTTEERIEQFRLSMKRIEELVPKINSTGFSCFDDEDDDCYEGYIIDNYDSGEATNEEI